MQSPRPADGLNQTRSGAWRQDLTSCPWGLRHGSNSVIPRYPENSKKENTEHRAAHENPEVLLLNRKGQCGLRVRSNFQFLALSPEKAQHEESGLLAGMADSGSGAGSVPSLGHLVTPASQEMNKRSYNSEATWQRGSSPLINRTPTATGRKKSGVFQPFRS